MSDDEAENTGTTHDSLNDQVSLGGRRWIPMSGIDRERSGDRPRRQEEDNPAMAVGEEVHGGDDRNAQKSHGDREWGKGRICGEVASTKISLRN